jgi:hypothetical protein
MTDLSARPGVPASFPVPESGDLAVAISVAQQMLAAYAGVDYSDVGAIAQAHGALRESLRILLRALGTEPVGAVPANGAESGERCPAAHPDDPTPCSGPAVVTILDAHNKGANGCEHHGARMLASLAGGRVYPLPDAPAGAAIRTFKASGTLRPFCWYGNEGEGQ